MTLRATHVADLLDHFGYRLSVRGDDGATPLTSVLGLGIAEANGVLTLSRLNFSKNATASGLGFFSPFTLLTWMSETATREGRCVVLTGFEDSSADIVMMLRGECERGEKGY